jgi:protein transport protein SEC24
MQQPQMLVVPDVDSMFLPISEEVIFVSYQNAKSIVDALLDKLPAMFASTKITDTAFGSVIQAGSLALVRKSICVTNFVSES